MADRVFTENDVRNLLRPLLHKLAEQRVALGRSVGQLGADDLERVLAQIVRDAPGELTEEVVARSAVDRLVALALVWGAHDYEGLPDAVWAGLYDEGLLDVASDQSGERWPILSKQGEAFLRAELERDR